jgi:hypothetical protein
MAMWRIVALCWVFTAPVLAGVLIVAVLMTPALSADAALWIPIAAALGFAYGVPCAISAAKFLEGPATDDPALRWGWGLSARN